MSDKNKHTNPRWDSSLRRFPWDEGKLTPLQELIETNELDHYSQKHPKAHEEEIAFLNSLVPADCPYCSSEHITKKGKYKDGIQRYLCKSCQRRFGPLTGTVFDSHKIPISEWIEYLRYLFEFHSITTSARDNKNAKTTGFYWLGKVFSVLDGIQDDVVLSGKIYLDETFFPVIRSDIVSKDRKKLRGISRNKICVGVAVSKEGCIILCENTNKPSMESTWRTFKDHIMPGSIIVHDGENSHSVLIERLHLKSEVHTTKETKGLPDRKNPMDRVNNIHYLLKRFMKEHGGYDREHIQDWMNIAFFALSSAENVYLRIQEFFELAVKHRKTIRYREYYSKKR